ncbi:hypothetical protein HYY75_07770, partial [bacterium]|nr:hypothetical protein [bacterium]
MSLRINTNITALNAQKNLVVNDERLSLTLERLSSGLRINRASDDAAGLTISEKLRTQVRGITRAIMNVQDGISLIQTAEGAMNETHSILQRMRELAIQAGNDTLTSNDRLEIQKEIEQLKNDINRISNTTEFNTKKLLDGSATAVISTSNPTTMDGVVTGEALTFSDFSVLVWPANDTVTNAPQRGVSQVQRSNIFTRTDGSIVTSSTTLQSIAQFYDKLGNFILEDSSTLYVMADNHQATVTVSKDLTLTQLSNRMTDAMTTDQLGGGLKIDGSNATIQVSGEKNGQLEVTSGRPGIVGRVTFTGDEALVRAFGFQEVVLAEDPVYSITVTNLGVEASLREQMTTKIAGNRAMGLIKGIDLVFQPPTAAFTETQKAVFGISIGSQFSFNIDDSVSSTGTVLISLAAGRFSMDQIVSLINDPLSVALSNVRARMNTNNVFELYTLNTGSAAYISISGLAGLQNNLGLADGRYTGTGGSAGSMLGRASITDFDFTTRLTSIIITDGHGYSAAVTITGNYLGGMASLVDDFNNQLQADGFAIRAYDNNGRIELRSTETGVQSNFRITDGVGPGSATFTLFLTNPQTTISGLGGDAGVQNFSLDSESQMWGYVVADDNAGVADNLSFYIADQTGRGAIVSILGGIASAGASFRTMSSIVIEINNKMSTNGISVDAQIITSTRTIRISASTPGTSGRLVITEYTSSASVTSISRNLGLSSTTYQNGTGDYGYTVHVRDS